MTKREAYLLNRLQSGLPWENVSAVVSELLEMSESYDCTEHKDRMEIICHDIVILTIYQDEIAKFRSLISDEA